MSKKLFGKVFIFLLVVGLLFAATKTVQAQAPTVVLTEAELTAALANPLVTQIDLGANIALTSTANVTRADISIDGKGFTITGPAAGHGIAVNASNVAISNLTVTGSAKTNINVYRVTGITLTNVVLANAGNAGMIVNGSQVTISNVTTSNNAWGGINVDQGTGVTEIPLLTVTNVTTHTSPIAGITAAIWVDTGDPTWVAVGDLYTVVAPPNGYLVFYDNTEFLTIAANFPIHNENLDIYYATIQEAMNAAAPGDTITVNGTHVLTSVVNVNKAVTLTCATGAKIQVSGTGDRFDVSAAATIQDCEIEKTDEVGQQDIIRLRASGITIKDNTIWGYWDKADPYYVSRAMIINAGGFSDILITGNEIYGLRQPAYISGTHTGTISNNYVHDTKGWVLEGGNLTFTGNTWANNIGDIAILGPNGTYPGVPAEFYTDIVAMSAANNGAVIEDQRMSPALLSVVYVDDNAAAGGNGTQATPYQTIQDGINRVISGGTVNIAAGTYAELLTINKEITLLGPNAGISAGVTPGMRVPEATVTFPTGLPIDSYLVSITSDNVTIDGFDFTYQEYLIALRPTLIGAKGVDNLTIVNNRFFGGEVAVEFVPTTTQPYSVALLIEDNYVDSGPFVNSRYNRGFYIYGTGGVIKNNVVLNTSIGIQILPHREPTGGTVEGNIVSGYSVGLYQNNQYPDSGVWTWKNNTVTMALNDRLGLKAQVNSPYTADVTFRGIHLINYGVYPGTVPVQDVFEGNSIDGTIVNTSGVIGSEAIRISNVEPPSLTGTTATFTGNSFTNYTTAINNSTNVILLAANNYWGSPCGPAPVIGNATVSPWYVDETMTTTRATNPVGDQTFIPTMSTIEMNAGLACAAPYSTITFEAGTVEYPGNIIIPDGREHLTIVLADGVKINANSPCFTVEADYTTIKAQNIGMAACVTVAGSNGIDVADGVKNLTVDGLEIYGPGVNGINFAGVITDVVLKDNFIHDLAGNGVFFGAQPVALSVGGIDIHGNMFQNNALKGIEASTYAVPAEYNSWGDVDGPAVATGGDGISTGVDADPFTHVDLYLESSGTPWANQVVSGQTITYTVMGHLVNANAADFALTYPENLTFVSSTASNSFGVESVTHTAGTRTLRFVGYSITGNKTGTLPIFSVTFTAGTPVVNAPMLLDELTDGFGMVGVQSSSNIYAAALLDSTVTIVTLPTISSTDIQGYYLSGEQRQFSVVLDNPSTGANYAHVYVDFTMTNAQVEQISLIEYSVDNGATWVALGTGPGTSFANVGTDIVGFFGKVDGGGFPMAPGASLKTLFRVTFVTRDAAVDLPTSYAVSMQLRDADALPTSNLLDEFTNTMYVYDKPTVTYTSDPYFIIGEAGNFAVTIVNPVTGKFYNNTAVFDVVLLNHAVADITAISCTDGTTTWNLKDSLVQAGDNVTARIGGLTDGFFTIPASLNVTLPCTVTYATAGTYTTSTSMVDVVSPLPERVVSANIPGTATVYAKPVITATNLGGPFDAGLPETVSLSIANASIPEPFEVVFSYPAGTVIVYNGVTYTCAATCPVIPVDLTAEPTVLDFTVTFDEAWTGDVSVSLFDSDWTPADRLLASASETGVVVNGNFVVTGTFSMQGRATRAGIPVTLTWGGTFATYGPTANTIEAISNNFSQTVTYGGYYTITTNQPRYLNVYADVTFSKIINVHANYPLPALVLRAGNAVWLGGNNVVNLDDANLVGTQWGDPGSASLTIDHGDVNFDNKVNIQDLALVGGNYELTSAGAYGTTWVP